MQRGVGLASLCTSTQQSCCWRKQSAGVGFHRAEQFALANLCMMSGGQQCFTRAPLATLPPASCWAQRAMVVFSCPICRRRFDAENPRVARSLRDRHRRETHGPPALRQQIVEKRKADDARRSAERRDSELDIAPSGELYILCPARREQTIKAFSLTKKAFMEKGTKAEVIYRLEGSREVN